MWQNYAMIGTTAPTAVATEGSGAYHDNYGDDGHPSGKNGLFQFLRFLLGMRKAHPCLRQDRFGDFSLDHGDDVTYWFKREDGFSDLREGDRAVHWRIDGSAIGDLDFLLCVNMRHLEADFALPPARPGKSWRRIVDTAAWAESHSGNSPRRNPSVIPTGWIRTRSSSWWKPDRMHRFAEPRPGVSGRGCSCGYP
jgi:glycogen operon protein